MESDNIFNEELVFEPKRRKLEDDLNKLKANFCYSIGLYGELPTDEELRIILKDLPNLIVVDSLDTIRVSDEETFIYQIQLGAIMCRLGEINNIFEETIQIKKKAAYRIAPKLNFDKNKVQTYLHKVIKYIDNDSLMLIINYDIKPMLNGNNYSG